MNVKTALHKKVSYAHPKQELNISNRIQQKYFSIATYSLLSACQLHKAGSYCRIHDFSHFGIFATP
jgi:hypothetical protein